MHIDAKGNDLLPDASDEELIMKKVVTCSQMKLLDHETIHSMHVPSLVLMERAALAVRDEIVKYLLGKNPDGSWQHERVLAVCGSGNNGGDGIAIARLLHLSGIHTEIFLAGNPDKMTEETRRQWEIAASYQVPVTTNPVWSDYCYSRRDFRRGAFPGNCGKIQRNHRLHESGRSLQGGSGHSVWHPW